MLFSLYRVATQVGDPFIHALLKRRLVAGKEDAGRFGERLGVAGRPRPSGPLVWLHAASVGEANSALVLVERLVADGLNVLMTTGTVTSAAVMAERLPAGALHQYVPVDRPAGVERFLDHWRPDAVLWMESEIWPNLLDGIARRGIPAALVNARMSARSFARWRWVQSLARRLLRGFSVCLAQTDAEAERLRALGAPLALCVGNLKFSAAPPPVDLQSLATLRQQIGTRPVWLAASIHPAEDAAVLAAHQHLAQRWPELVTIVVPRHPQRGADIAAKASAAGMHVARRALGEPLGAGVYIGDTIGEMGLYYSLAPVAFVGGSLQPHGGQNPIEAALLGAALVMGPSRYNFASVTAELVAADALSDVVDADSLSVAVAALLTDADVRQARVDRARSVVDGHMAVVDRVMQALQPVLAGLGR
jgi:3-deoxy-D-manno-octulosonic-acid transferase